MTEIKKCECGFPIRPVGVTMKEFFFTEKRVIVKHEQKCPNCKKVNVVYG